MKPESPAPDSEDEPDDQVTGPTRAEGPRAPEDVARHRAALAGLGVLEPGVTLGRYVIEKRLGQGGMGVVYLARDPELHRRLAIKLLHLDRDEPAAEARARFRREAQALAKVSHPAVVGIHDVGSVGEQVFIALELVEGLTLARWLRVAPRPLRQILDVFARAGEGLAAAHAAGLVHRDFKPENVIVGLEGRVRVLDFGLARRAEGATAMRASSLQSTGGVLAASLTRPGAMAGTPGYMAPEQYLEQSLDARTDQFSFCVTLFEALHGQRPFPGRDFASCRLSTLSGQIQAVKDRHVPPWLERLVYRGLSVSPDDRFPSMQALLTELRGDRGLRRRRVIVAAALLPIGAFGAFMLRARRGSRGPEATGGGTGALARHRQLTFGGDVADHAISPDGESLAFASAGKYLLVEIATGRVRVLWDPGPEATISRLDPAWSPDGTELVVTFREARAKSVMIRRTGGKARELPIVADRPAFSPDGQQIAFVQFDGADRKIWFHGLAGPPRPPITIGAAFDWIADLQWSEATGQLLAACEHARGTQLWAVDPASGTQSRLLDEPGRIASARWGPDGRAVYYVRSREERAELLALSAPGSPAASVRALHGLELGNSVSLSRDGRRLTYCRRSSRSNLFLVERGADGEGRPKRLTSGTRLLRALSLSPDGLRLAFAASDGRTSELFIMPTEGGEEHPHTSLGAAVKATAWSPDGRRIAFVAERNGVHRVWTVDAAGGQPQEHTHSEAAGDGSPSALSWAPSPEILYSPPGFRDCRMLDAARDVDRPLFGGRTAGWVYRARASPDGRFVAVHRHRQGFQGSLARIALAGNAEAQLLEGEHFPMGWSADGKWIHAWIARGRRSTITVEAVRATDGEVKQLVELPYAATDATEVVMTPDARRLVLSVDETTSDAWMVEGFR